MAGYRLSSIEDAEKDPEYEAALARYEATANGAPKPLEALAGMATGATPRRIQGPTLTLGPGGSVGSYSDVSPELTPEEEAAQGPISRPAQPSLLDRASALAADVFTGDELQARMARGEESPRLNQAADTIRNLANSLGPAARRVAGATGIGAAANAIGEDPPLPDVSLPLPGQPPMASPVATPAPRRKVVEVGQAMETPEQRRAVVQTADSGPGASSGPPSPLALAQQRQAASATPSGPSPLELALSRARDSRLIATLARAGGTAIGRGSSPGYDNLDENADRPLQEYAARQGEAEQQRVRALAAQEADPNSAQSRQARAVLGQMLPTMAKRPEFAGMSAAQIKSSFPMLKEVVDREMASASLAARAEEARLGRENALKVAGIRARGKGGAGGAREADVQKLGKDTEGLAKIKADVALLERLAGASGDIPGAGVWDTRKPGFLQSPADTDAYQATLRVAAELLHQQSGASVTPQEAERFLESRGMGKGTTEQQFRAGAKALVRDLRAELAAKVAKYPDAARSEATRRGVIMDLPAGAPTSAAGAPDDDAAVRWAKANPTDPRAARILELNR